MTSDPPKVWENWNAQNLLKLRRFRGLHNYASSRMGKLPLKCDGVLAEQWCPLDAQPPYQPPDSWNGGGYSDARARFRAVLAAAASGNPVGNVLRAVFEA